MQLQRSAALQFSYVATFDFFSEALRMSKTGVAALNLISAALTYFKGALQDIKAAPVNSKGAAIRYWQWNRAFRSH